MAWVGWARLVVGRGRGPRGLHDLFMDVNWWWAWDKHRYNPPHHAPAHAPGSSPTRPWWSPSSGSWVEEGESRWASTPRTTEATAGAMTLLVEASVFIYVCVGRMGGFGWDGTKNQPSAVLRT